LQTETHAGLIPFALVLDGWINQKLVVMVSLKTGSKSDNILFLLAFFRQQTRLEKPV
jgi:hypothetical protein